MHLGDVAQAPVLHHHALGTTGGARGVDHVCGVIDGRARFGSMLWLGGDAMASPSRARWWDPQGVGSSSRTAILGEEQDDARVLEHQLQAILRIGWVERHIGPAGLEDAQDGEDHRWRAVHRDAHPMLRADPEAAEVVGELIGLLVQRSIARHLLTEAERGRVRAAVGPGLEERGEGLALRGCSASVRFQSTSRVCRSATERSDSSPTGLSGAAAARSSRLKKVREHPLDRRARRRDRSHIRWRPRGLRGLDHAEGDIEFGGGARAPTHSRARSGGRRHARGVFWRPNITWKRGCGCDRARDRAPAPGARRADPGGHRRRGRSP
jgi:hypothetical protein